MEFIWKLTNPEPISKNLLRFFWVLYFFLMFLFYVFTFSNLVDLRFSDGLRDTMYFILFISYFIFVPIFLVRLAHWSNLHWLKFFAAFTAMGSAITIGFSDEFNRYQIIDQNPIVVKGIIINVGEKDVTRGRRKFFRSINYFYTISYPVNEKTLFFTDYYDPSDYNPKVGDSIDVSYSRENPKFAKVKEENEFRHTKN